MSVYLVRLTKGNQRPHPDFKAKGLDHLHPCTLTNCEVYGLPHKRQVAYSAYIHSLSAFLHATEVQARVSVDAEGYPIKLSSDKVLQTFTLPPLGVTFAKKPTADKISTMETSHGARYIKNMGQDIFIMDESSFALAKEMMSLNALPDARTPAGVANLNGLQSFLHCMKVVTLFCATHTYPAFSTPLSDPDTVHNFAVDSEIRVPREGNNVSNKRRKIFPEPAADDSMVEDDAELESIADDLRTNVSLQEAVVNAKPAPFFPNLNFGPVSAVPAASGLVFEMLIGRTPEREKRLHM